MSHISLSPKELYSLLWEKNKPVHYGKEEQSAIEAYRRQRIDN